MHNYSILESKNTEEQNVLLLTVCVSNSDVVTALNNVYMSKKSRLQLPGFRMGKVSRAMYEKAYGKNVFLEDALEKLVPEVLTELVETAEPKILEVGEVDVTQVSCDEDLIMTVQVAVKPEVTLGQYKGLKYTKNVILTEEEVEEEIKNICKRNAKTRSVKRPVQNGDTVTLDFKGYVNGVPFEGGEGYDYSLEIGSHSFIDGFEDQLIGAELNRSVDVYVVFPDNYHAEELAGKPAKFECMINGISESVVPSAEEAAIKDGYDSLDSLIKDVREYLLKAKEKKAEDDMMDTLVNKAVANSVLYVPELVISKQVEVMMDSFTNQLQLQGLNLEQYAQFTGQTEESLRESIRPQALNNLCSTYVLEAIAAAENIEALDSEIDAELKSLSQTYNMDVDEVRRLLGERSMKDMANSIRINKAVKLIVETSAEE